MAFDFVIPEIGINGAGTPPLEFFRRGFRLGGSGSTPSWQDIILSGNGSLSLTNAKANSLNYLKLYGGCEQRNLPSGYTEYDGLIESDGLAYINLNCSLMQDDEIELEFTKTSNVLSKDIFGGRSSASSNNISVILAGSGNVVEDFNNSDYTDYRLNTAVSLNTRYKVVMNKTGRYLYQGDTLVASDTTANPDTITTTGCYLFSLAGTGLGSKFQGTIHRCLIKGKRDVVPCGNGTAYGMYDKLNGVFYPNANTGGSFTVGNATVPTPDYPVDIVCNNGALKFSKPITIDSTRNYAYINTTGSWAWSSDSYSIALPVTVGKKYRIIISSTDSSIVGTIFRYGFTDSDPEDFKQSKVTPSPVSISIYDFWRGTPQDVSDVEVTATHPYMIIQFAAAYASTVVSTYLTVIDQSIYTDGTVETVKDSLDNTATATDLLAIDTYKDVQEVLTGAITRNIGIKVLDGVTTGKMFSSAWNATYKRCNLTISDMLISVAATEDAICNLFPYSSSVNTSPTSLGFCTNNGYLLVSFIGMENITSANDANAWLAQQYNAGTPVIVIYPLATATTESVTGQHLSIRAGTNVVEITQASIDNLELEVSYKAGVEVTITEVQNANLSNQVTVTIGG